MLDVHINNRLAVNKQLALLAAPKNKKRAILRAAARKAKSQAGKHLRSQTDLDGRAFKTRWQSPHEKRNRAKLLRKLGRNMKVFADDKQGKVYYKGIVGYVANKQQQGFTQTHSTNDMKSRNSHKRNNDPATARQVSALYKLGVTTRDGGRKRKASKKWLRDNMTVGKAGAIIRTMRGAAKKNWTTKTPGRSHLGASRPTVTAVNDTFAQMLAL